MKHLFGPVASRRLGISLGVDLVPHKVCSLDCVYCECGRTTNLTTEIKEYIDPDEVIRELDEYLSHSPSLDVITFAGSGEPTLNSGIGRIIDFLKEKYPSYRVAVLTNGTLLWKDEVRTALSNADLVIPSLDAVTSETFENILRPAVDVTPEKLVSGLETFSREFGGEMIVEIFIIPGFNDSDSELAALKLALDRIQPDKIQLNKLDRPGTEEWVEEASKSELERIRDFLFPHKVEIIGAPPDIADSGRNFKESMERIIATLKRRPSTVDDLSSVLGLRRAEVVKILWRLIENEQVEKEEMSRGVFYRIKL